MIFRFSVHHLQILLPSQQYLPKIIYKYNLFIHLYVLIKHHMLPPPPLYLYKCISVSAEYNNSLSLSLPYGYNNEVPSLMRTKTLPPSPLEMRSSSSR